MNDRHNLHIKGMLNFFGDPNSSFNGPIKRGFRPIIWGNDIKKGCTSVSVISKNEIFKGQQSDVELVILSPFILDKDIIVGAKLFIGSTLFTIGEIQITEIFGYWKEAKVP